MDNYIFKVSAAAQIEIKNQLIKRGTPNSYLRIGVKGGGCSGYQYYLEYEDNKRNNDLLFTFDNISVLIDKKSIIYLNNAVLDWENSLLRKGFIFNNPNVKSSCGCKNSIDF